MICEFCAGGLVFAKSKLLILKRFNGIWLFPKGHIEPGETPEMAAIREVREESGLAAQIIGNLGETSYTFSERGDQHYKTVHWFLMETESDRISLEREFFIDGQFIAEDKTAVLTFPADRQLAEKAFHLHCQKENE